MEEDRLEQIVRLAEELITVMDNEKSEQKLLEDINEKWQKVTDVRELQKARTKDIIQGMLEMKADAEIESARGQLELQRQEMDKRKCKARHDITLYKLITNIHWDLDTPPNEIRGFVCGKKEVKPFSLDKSKMSSYDITNSLWDMIEEAGTGDP